MRGSRTVFLLVMSILFALMFSGEAFAGPFVEGESLEWCPSKTPPGKPSGGLVLSGDGQTAISGECVYVRSGGSWVEQESLPLPEFTNPIGDTEVHYAISSDGNTVIASGEFTPSGDPVFVRSSGTWAQQATLPHASRPDLSGNGNTVALSGQWENKHSVIDIFIRSGELWSKQAALTRTVVQKGKKGELEATDFFPASLSGDGNTLLAYDWESNKGKGAAFIYVRSGETWTETATLAPNGIKGKRNFGGRGELSADGATALVPETSERSKGAIWFFTRSGETWSQQGPKIAPKLKGGAPFGRESAISGDGSTALVLSGNRHKGQRETIWVYERSGETWTNTEQLLPPGNPQAGSYNFAEAGVDLSEDGNTAMADYELYSVSHQALTWAR